MLSPAAAMILDRKKLQRKAELALAEYRHAWDYGSDEDELEWRHRQAVEAVAAVRALDACVSISHVVSTDTHADLARRMSQDIHLRNEISFSR